MVKFQDKTVVITGASSGLGKAFAIRVARDGAKVYLAARRKEKLEETARLVTDAGGTPVIVQTDVTKPEQIKNLFLKATEGEQVLDLVFNNAGLGYIAPIEDLPAEQIQTMINVNVTGMIMVSKYASEVMTRQKHGHIIMTSSLAGLISLPQWSVYVASKWAITGFADSIRPELAADNVRVTTLHPGAVKTEFFDKEKANIDISTMGKEEDIITPEDVADALYETAFTDKNRLLIPEMAKNFALLYRFVPGLAQNQLAKLAQEVEYHDQINEDEPDFSYIKEVGNSNS